VEELPAPEAPAEFWNLLHAALGLQLEAMRAAEAGDLERARDHEATALLRLMRAVGLVAPGSPGAAVVEALSTAGLARMVGLRRRLGAAG